MATDSECKSNTEYRTSSLVSTGCDQDYEHAVETDATDHDTNGGRNSYWGVVKISISIVQIMQHFN